MNQLVILKKILGDVPEKGSFHYKQTRQIVYANYTLILFDVHLLHNEIVEVQVTIPNNSKSREALPLVLCNHSHGGNYHVGKKEILEGAEYLASPSFAETLSQLGFATISIDARGFGTRAVLTEAELVKTALIHGSTLWGLMLNDLVYLLDFIEYQQQYHFSEIGALGMSMGGLMSWWLAALDSRIKWIVDIAAQVDLETLEKENLLNKHGHYYYVPSFLKYFSTKDIQKLIAPRRRLSLVGNSDLNCPIEGVIKLEKFLTKAYHQMGKDNQWHSHIVKGGHEETLEMRQIWVNFLKEGYSNDCR